jgi:predicted Zn-dependent protease
MYQLEADRSFARGETEAAVTLLQTATSVDPSDSRAQYRLGLGYIQSGRFGDAVTVLKALEAREGTARNLTLALATAYVAQGDEPKATEALLRGGLSSGQANLELTAIRSGLRSQRK